MAEIWSFKVLYLLAYVYNPLSKSHTFERHWLPPRKPSSTHKNLIKYYFKIFSFVVLTQYINRIVLWYQLTQVYTLEVRFPGITLRHKGRSMVQHSLSQKTKLAAAFNHYSIKFSFWASHGSNETMLPKPVVRLSKLSTWISLTQYLNP